MRKYSRVAGRYGIGSWLLLAVLFVASALPSTAFAYDVGVNDKLTVRVAGSPEFGTVTRVREDGTINMPYLDDVKVAGRSLQAIEQRIAGLLRSRELLNDPQVSVNVKQNLSRQVTVLGEVASPGRYPLMADETILDVLAMAGGRTDEGADHLVITRKTDSGQARRRFPLDPMGGGKLSRLSAKAGDMIMVPEMDAFFIEGAVNSPGRYRLRDGMTVMQAIAVGGGLTPRGSYGRIRIERRGKDGKVRTIDVERDASLQVGDLIHVRERLF